LKRKQVFAGLVDIEFELGRHGVFSVVDGKARSVGDGGR
jgi:hypothetical protein